MYCQIGHFFSGYLMAVILLYEMLNLLAANVFFRIYLGNHGGKFLCIGIQKFLGINSLGQEL